MNNNLYMDLEKRVKDEIKHAFLSVPNPFDLEFMDLNVKRGLELLDRSFNDDDDYVGNNYDADNKILFDWYVDLSLISDEAFYYVLPRLMLSLIKGYPGETNILVNYLYLCTKVLNPTNMSTPEKGMYSGEFFESVTKIASAQKTRTINGMSEGQIFSVCNWLRLVANWDEVGFYLNEIEGTIEVLYKILNVEN